MFIHWIIELNNGAVSAEEYLFHPAERSAEASAETLRKRLVETRDVRNAVLTASDGRCFCLRDGYLFDLDYDPNEFLVLPLWPHEEKKA